MVPAAVRFRVGDFRCVVLCDGISPITEKDVTNIFAKDAEKMLAVFRALPEPLSFSVNILFVETAGKRVLIDCGSGQADPAHPGHLLDQLRAEGIAPESIDTVIITHLHQDHFGGLLDEAGNTTFAKARLVVRKQEYDHWMREDFLAEMDQNRARRLRQTFAAYSTRQMLVDDTVNDTLEIEPGIRYVSAFGHTPGHSGVSVESHGTRLLHIVDTAHVPFQLNVVEASPSFDTYPDMAIVTRRTLLERIESEKLLMMAYHFPFPGLGNIQRSGDLREWVPYPHSATHNTHHPAEKGQFT